MRKALTDFANLSGLCCAVDKETFPPTVLRLVHVASHLTDARNDMLLCFGGVRFIQ